MEQDSVELFETVVMDDELALSLVSLLEPDRGAQPLRQVILQPRHIRVGAGLPIRLVPSALQVPHQRLRLPDRQSPRYHPTRRFYPLHPIRQTQQCPCMPHLDLMVLKQSFDLSRQLEQSQQIGHGNPRASDRFRHLFMGEPEFLRQTLKSVGLFQGAQVFSLDVLDQRYCERSLIRHVPHNGRNFLQSGELGRPPSTLTGNELEAFAVRNGSDDHGLDHALGTDGVRQILQRLGRNVRAWLKTTTTNFVHCNTMNFARCRLGDLRTDARTEQRIEPSSEPPLLNRHEATLQGLAVGPAGRSTSLNKLATLARVS
jgi:hypothetical protein